MGLSINEFASRYMYTNSQTGQTRLNLDTSADGVWSKQEVENYAADYEAVAGKTVDVDAVFDTYDSDKSGTLDYSEYDRLLADDALGTADLVALKEAADAVLSEITTTEEDGTNTAFTELLSSLNLDASTVAELIGSDETNTSMETETEESSGTTSIAEYMASLTDAQRLSWIKSTFQAESTTNLIASMLDPDAALSNLSSLISQYGRAGSTSDLSSLSSALDIQV